MDTAASYDELPYGDRAFIYTHPDRIAAVATLHGITPPPLDSCRVLELGCASGGNIIPMAVTMPNAQFTGIDISPRQVERGQEIIATLGLKNIRLETANILDFAAPPGSFDYIICHGVYSWVPPEVQQKVLSLFRDLLAPNGVAYVSYNCLPGWRLRGILRDILRFHVRDTTDIHEQVAQSKEILRFLPGAFPNDTLYGGLIVQEAKELASAHADYLFHEHLEVDNEPLYFREFVRRIREHELEFVAEADVFAHISRIAPDVMEQLMNASSDYTEFEQYVDFLIGRMFRRSLLVKAGTSYSPARRPDAIQHLYLSGRFQPAGEIHDVASDSPAEFTREGTGSVTTNHPMMKAAFLALSKPGRLSFQELWEYVAETLNVPAERHEEAKGELTKLLVRCYSGRALEIHQQPAPFTVSPGSHPVASPYARWQASEGFPDPVSLAHRSYTFGDFQRLLLERLDGTRDRKDLLNDLLKLAAEGVFEITKDGQRVTDPDRLASVLDDGISTGIQDLARQAYLLH